MRDQRRPRRDPNFVSARYEVSSDPENFTRNPSRHIPESPLQALMEAQPHDEPRESVEEQAPLKEAIADCMMLLSDQDQFIINAINTERLTLAQLGKRLGVSKPHTMRLRDKAYTNLKVLLAGNQVVRDKMGFEDDDE